MNIPMQNQGQLIGASLLHSGCSRKFSSQTRALARQFNGNLSYSEMLKIIGQEADRLNHIVNNIVSELQRQPLGDESEAPVLSLPNLQDPYETV